MGKVFWGVPVWTWMWGAVSAACVTIPLLAQMNWKVLVLSYQIPIIAILAVVATLGTLVQMRSSNNEIAKRRENRHKA